MHVRLLRHWEQLRGSYWFLPSVMTLGAGILAIVLTIYDERIGSDWIEQVRWLSANRPDGARALLSTVAGSMITVAGVTFSITIGSVVYASSQYGPRLLTNFMRDTGNQFTLGTFISTFLYCLLVLRTVRSGDEGGGGFVPHLALLVGVAFALLSLGVLIFFIHHVPDSIHVSNVVSGIGRSLLHRVESELEEVGEEAAPVETEAEPHRDLAGAAVVRHRRDGYLQGLDVGQLVEVATEHGLRLRSSFRPGDFVIRGEVLVHAWPASAVDEAVEERIRDAYLWGSHRTQAADLLFLVDELIEIAARALSPGVNDPFTAINCMDWLGSALAEAGRRRETPAVHRDDEGVVRVVVRPVTFERLAGEVFDRLRPYASVDRNAALHLVGILGRLSLLAPSEHRPVLREKAVDLRDACLAALSDPHDRALVEERTAVVVQLLDGGDDAQDVALRHPWLGGSG